MTSAIIHLQEAENDCWPEGYFRDLSGRKPSPRRYDIGAMGERHAVCFQAYDMCVVFITRGLGVGIKAPKRPLHVQKRRAL